MYVFVSWAYTRQAQDALLRLAAWVESIQAGQLKGEADNTVNLTTKLCLPEYHAFEAAVAAAQVAGEQIPSYDDFNYDLLAVKFVIPAMERVVLYQSGKRLHDSKLSVSLATRAFLLNTFEGEWNGDLSVPCKKRLIFVGLKGVGDFLTRLSISCGVMGQPMPVDFWAKPNLLELPDDDVVRKIIDARAFNQTSPAAQEKYQSLIHGWMGTGASADRDVAIAVATAFSLGLKGVV